MKPYSCSSSIGTAGRSFGAIRRPATGAADSRFATRTRLMFEGVVRAPMGAVAAATVVGGQRAEIEVVDVTFVCK
jgi:hypothetical protein